MTTFRTTILTAVIILLPLISFCRNKSVAPVITSFAPISGHYGDTITINGSGFLTADIYYVAFGDYQATDFWVVSDTEIKAIVDNGTSGEVYIYSSSGDASLAGFTYTGPTIFRFTPTTLVNDPTEVKIYGRYFTGVNQVLFGGFPAASFIVNSDSLITAVVGEPGFGEIVVGSANGFSAASGFISPLITSFEPEQGTTGDTITIHGWNFSGVDQVLLGNFAAKTFSIVSDSLIKAVVGLGESGPVNVVSSIDNSLAFTFHYIPYQPHIQSFFPTSGTSGDTITIKGDHLLYTTNVSFAGTSAVSFKVISDTIVKAVIGSGSSGYIFIATGDFIDSLGVFTYHIDQPVITSVSPSSGKMGDIITIKGYGFNKTTAANTVYFGPTRANILSGTDSTLLVTVPGGTMFSEITVTNKHLTASSAKPFSIIFPGASDKISVSSFSTPLKLLINSTGPGKWVTADFDNDGRIDVASINDPYVNVSEVTVFRNTGVGTSISFGPSKSWKIGQDTRAGIDITVVDLDGDGKLDLVGLNPMEDSVTVLKNISTPGNIAFITAAVLSTHTPNLPQENQAHAETLVVKDFDLDGKPDIAFAAFELTPLCTYIYRKNTSTDNVISFGVANETALWDAWYIYCTDLNNDRKPDLAVVNTIMGTTASKITIFRNQSVTDPNFILSSYTGSNEQDIYHTPAFGDLDGDNKPDIVTADGPFGTISVFRNFSSDSSDIGFDQPMVIPISSPTNSTALTDLDGDGKLDIIVSTSTNGSNQIWVLKNRSTVGSLIFDTARIYSGPAVSNILLIADFNNDGRPDIFTTGPTGSFISIFVNKVGSIRFCPGSGTVLSSNLSGSAYQWQVSTGSASSFSNISNNSNYADATTASLTLSNIPSSFSGYRYRCIVDGTNSEAYTIHVENTWLGSVDASWANPANWSCGVVPDVNSEVLIPSGSVVVSSNATCKSITVSPNAHLTINPGVTLTVTH